YTGHSLFASILPYLDQTPLYNQLNWNIAGWAAYPTAIDPVHENAVKTVIPGYICPSSPTGKITSWDNFIASFSFWGGAVTHYIGIAGSIQSLKPASAQSSGGTFFRNSNIAMRNLTDGSSNTFIIGEYSGYAEGQQTWLQAHGYNIQNQFDYLND